MAIFYIDTSPIINYYYSEMIDSKLTEDKEKVSTGEGWRFDKSKEVIYCSYYIRRKKRKCTHRVSTNSSEFCSDHSPAGLAEARALAVISMDRHISQQCNSTMNIIINKIAMIDDENDITFENYQKTKKMRVSAPHRMANPFRFYLTLYHKNLICVILY